MLGTSLDELAMEATSSPQQHCCVGAAAAGSPRCVRVGAAFRARVNARNTVPPRLLHDEDTAGSRPNEVQRMSGARLVEQGFEVGRGSGAESDLVLLEQLPHLALRQRRLRRAALHPEEWHAHRWALRRCKPG